MRYYIEHLPMTIPMGVQSENNAEAVEFDVSDWLARDGSLSFSVWVTRPGETEAYQAANATLKDGILYWWPTSADTAIAGEGRVEILAVSANRRMLSGWTATSIRETTTETTTDAPVDQRPWLDQALLASEEAKAAAASAAASADQAEGVVKKEIATLTQDKINKDRGNLWNGEYVADAIITNDGHIMEAERYAYTAPMYLRAGNYLFNRLQNIYGSNAGIAVRVKEDGNIIGVLYENSYDAVKDVSMVALESGYYCFNCGRYGEHTETFMVVAGSSFDDWPDAYRKYGDVRVEDGIGFNAKMQSELETHGNILYGKTAAFDGDSICHGTSAGDGKSGWAGRIGRANNMVWKNYGDSGATITAEVYSDGGGVRHWISRNIDTIHQEMPELDYLILEGGTNDADLLDESTQMGEFDLGDFGGVYDDTTFCGALETLFYKTVTYYPYAKIGYIVAHRMGYNQYTSDYDITGSWRYRYFVKAMEICKKWGIPYLNLWDTSHMNPKLPSMYNQTLDADGNIDGGYLYTDGQHLTPIGYERITPIIEAWMRTL